MGVLAASEEATGSSGRRGQARAAIRQAAAASGSVRRGRGSEAGACARMCHFAQEALYLVPRSRRHVYGPEAHAHAAVLRLLTGYT
jgi:hypothetical protein